MQFLIKSRLLTVKASGQLTQVDCIFAITQHFLELLLIDEQSNSRQNKIATQDKKLRLTPDLGTVVLLTEV
jgi:hypothetical protein